MKVLLFLKRNEKNQKARTSIVESDPSQEKVKPQKLQRPRAYDISLKKNHFFKYFEFRYYLSKLLTPIRYQFSNIKVHIAGSFGLKKSELSLMWQKGYIEAEEDEIT